MMKLTPTQTEKIKSISRLRYPKEAVFGITAKGVAVELENIANDPLNDFEIDTTNYYDKGYVALVHSHTVKVGTPADQHNYVDSRSPSGLDMQTQQSMNQEWGILAVDEDNVTDIVWFPDLEGDILGQPYISGINDCYTLFQRYYWQNYKVLLKQMQYTPLWWKENPSLYVDNFKSAGFYEIKEHELQVGDMILIKIMGNIPTHSAMYIGEDKIMHHLANRLSVVENYSKWRSRMVTFLSHKKGTS